MAMNQPATNLQRFAWATVICGVVFGASQEAEAGCVVPEHVIVQDVVGRWGTGNLRVSIAPEALMRQNLLCLAEHLSAKNPLWADVYVYFFTSTDEAEQFDSTFSDLARMRSLRGIYRHYLTSRSLTVTPFGSADLTRWITEISWPPPTDLPPCRLQLNNRCLLSAEPIVFPTAELRRSRGASVVVAGHVGRDGKVHDARINGKITVEDEPFAQSALTSLQSLWFEPAETESMVRIEYAYVIDSSLPRRNPTPVWNELVRRQFEGGMVDMEFELPGRVTIYGYPIQ